ncbi:MAG: type II secretion system protein GspG [Phycisphaerae bacterium]
MPAAELPSNCPAQPGEAPCRRCSAAYLRGLLIGVFAGGVVCLILGFFLSIRVFASARHSYATAMLDLVGLNFSIDMFQYDAGRPPTLAEGIAILQQLQPRGPYLKNIPLDPWGRPYVYKFAPDGTPIVGTLGRDGLPGGTVEDTDLEMHVKLRMPLPAAFTNGAPPATQPIPPIISGIEP